MVLFAIFYVSLLEGVRGFNQLTTPKKNMEIEKNTDKILGLASNSPKNRNMFLIESPIYQWENNNHLQQIEVCWFCVKSICPPATQHSYGR
jgi:hypothetical protein